MLVFHVCVIQFSELCVLTVIALLGADWCPIMLCLGLLIVYSIVPVWCIPAHCAMLWLLLMFAVVFHTSRPHVFVPKRVETRQCFARCVRLPCLVDRVSVMHVLWHLGFVVVETWLSCAVFHAWALAAYTDSLLPVGLGAFFLHVFS